MENRGQDRSAYDPPTDVVAPVATPPVSIAGDMIPPLLDETLPLQTNELGALLRSRSRLAAAWSVPIQRPDGSFPYAYEPDRDRYILDQYNEVRHAGATYALFQACQLFDDESLRSCARRAVDYIAGSSISLPDGGAVFLRNGRCKLGGQALAIVALLQGRRTLETAAWDDVIAALAEFLLALELPDEPGRYFQSFEAATQQKLLTPASNFFPGEALLALTRLHAAFPDGPWLAAARRAARYLVRVKDGDQIAAGTVPREDHWLTIALSELSRFDPDPDYATIVFWQADRMIRSQYRPDDPQPWRIGAARARSTPPFTTTATQAEALNAAWELARMREDPGAVERCSLGALRSAQFLMRVQYTEANTRLFARPERAIGAWAQDADYPHIRIDFVQHGLSALVDAARLLQTGATP